MDPRLLDHYTGRYQLPDRILEIMRNGDCLFAQVTAVGGKPIAGPAFEMFVESENIFFVKVTGGRISFEIDPDGRATSLIMHRAGREPVPAPDCPDSRLHSVCRDTISIKSSPSLYRPSLSAISGPLQSHYPGRSEKGPSADLMASRVTRD